MDTRYYNGDIRHDFAVLPYQIVGAHSWSGYWLQNRPQHNLVKSCSVAPIASTCEEGSRNYSIVGLYTHAALQVGWVVCATGTGTAAIYSENQGYTAGTRCGQIVSENMLTYSTEYPTGYGMKVNICSGKGDSGGPLFGQQSSRAYGILSGGPPRTGGCNLSDPQDYSVYSPIGEIPTKAAYIWLSRFEEAGTHFNEALERLGELSNRAGQAHAHLDFTWMYERQGRPREVLEHAEQALELYNAEGHLAGQARALNAVGWAHALLGDYRETLTYCGRALDLLKQLGDRSGAAYTWDSLGYAQRHLDRVRFGCHSWRVSSSRGYERC